MKGRKPKKSHEKKQPVSLTGYQWCAILNAIDIKLMDLDGEWEDQAYVLLEIENKILSRVVLPPIKG